MLKMWRCWFVVWFFAKKNGSHVCYKNTDEKHKTNHTTMTTARPWWRFQDLSRSSEFSPSTLPWSLGCSRAPPIPRPWNTSLHSMKHTHPVTLAQTFVKHTKWLWVKMKTSNNPRFWMFWFPFKTIGVLGYPVLTHSHTRLFSPPSVAWAQQWIHAADPGHWTSVLAAPRTNRPALKQRSMASAKPNGFWRFWKVGWFGVEMSCLNVWSFS